MAATRELPVSKGRGGEFVALRLDERGLRLVKTAAAVSVVNAERDRKKILRLINVI